MGGTVGRAPAPTTGAHVNRVSVQTTVTGAIGIGRATLAAGQRHEDPVDAVLAATVGVHLLDARIVDLGRRLEGGFSVGEFAIGGIGASRGDRARAVSQHAFLGFSRNGWAEVSVPDLSVVGPVATACTRWRPRDRRWVGAGHALRSYQPTAAPSLRWSDPAR
jgi:DUF917 family protein